MNEKALEGLVIRTSREFGSTTDDHRARLRLALKNFITEETAKVPGHHGADFQHAVEALANLKIRPRVPGWAISVSHCATLGGFLATKSADDVGIDFENQHRVSEPLAMRVASFPDEKNVLETLRDAGASWALFWVAKEAAIKAFGNRFPHEAPHFGEVEISAIDLSAGTFTARRDGLLARGRFLDSGIEGDSDIVGAIARIFHS